MSVCLEQAKSTIKEEECASEATPKFESIDKQSKPLDKIDIKKSSPKAQMNKINIFQKGKDKETLEAVSFPLQISKEMNKIFTSINSNINSNKKQQNSLVSLNPLSSVNLNSTEAKNEVKAFKGEKVNKLNVNNYASQNLLIESNGEEKKALSKNQNLSCRIQKTNKKYINTMNKEKVESFDKIEKTKTNIVKKQTSDNLIKNVNSFNDKFNKETKLSSGKEVNPLFISKKIKEKVIYYLYKIFRTIKFKMIVEVSTTNSSQKLIKLKV